MRILKNINIIKKVSKNQNIEDEILNEEAGGDLFVEESSEVMETLEVIEPKGSRDGKSIAGNSFDSLAAWVLTIGAFLLPLYFLPGKVLPLEFEKTILLSAVIVIAFLLWVIARLKEGAFSIPRHVLLLGGLFVLAAFFVSTLFSPSFNASFGGFVYEIGTFASMLFLFLLMFLSSMLFRSEQRILRLYTALIASFALVFLFHISRLLLGADFLSFGIFVSNISSLAGKWNDVAVITGMTTLLSFLALEFAAPSKTTKTLLYVSLVISLILLAIVNFFLVWVVLGVIALIILVFNLTFSQFTKGNTGPEGRNISIPAISILLISVLFLVAGASLGRTIADFTNISHAEVRPSWGATASIVGETWKENFLLGSGPNRFTNQWLLHKPDGINETFFWNTDFSSGIGLIPTFAVTTGPLGTAAWIIFFLLFLYITGFRSLFVSGSQTARFISISSAIVSLYLWIVAIFYVPNIVIFSFAFLMTGVLIAASSYQGRSRNFNFSVTKDPRVGFVSVLALIVLLIASVLGGYTVFQKQLSISRLSASRLAFTDAGDFLKAEEMIGKAIQVNSTDSLYRLLSDIEIARLNELLNQPDATLETIRAEFQQTLGEAINAGQKATELDETNYANWLALGEVYAAVVPLEIPGAYENAKTSFKRALELNPKSPAIVFEQARLEATRGNNKEARAQIKEALVLKSNYTDALFLLAQIDINEGNVRGAITSLERASLVNPNDIGLFFRLGLLKYSESDYAGAIFALERSISLSPNYSNAKYFLGLSYNNTGRTEDAIRVFGEVLQLNPDNTEVQQIIENLNDGKNPFDGIIPPAEQPEDRNQPPIVD